MNLLSKIPFLNKKQQPWWIKIYTTIPCCIYYFGPFDSAEEAKLEQIGYIEDLMQEKAQGITVDIVQCLPDSLTIFEEE